ncbi:MAG: nitroreductase family protein [Oscillospiraceae bacterium]|nr:nitroreductase family protein [Oscillospiraceae bacterium]MBQ8978804.1 nitroreductase family protein [Oscillospiraceae bacterium]
MTVKEAIKHRRSIRRYKDTPLPDDIRVKLAALAVECSCENVSIKPVFDDKDCFDTFLAHYGKFRNAFNYFVLTGRKDTDSDETAGYMGQKLVLAVEEMGLGTCWVGGTFSKGKCKAELGADEKIICIIAVGYPDEEGSKHRCKPMDKICSVKEEDMPAWFRNGVVAALYAPTAMNQQKFMISLDEDKVKITCGKGPFVKVDLGIVKYNFEAASGHEVIK